MSTEYANCMLLRSDSQTVLEEKVVAFTTFSAQYLLDDTKTRITFSNIWDIRVLVRAAAQRRAVGQRGRDEATGWPRRTALSGSFCGRLLQFRPTLQLRRHQAMSRRSCPDLNAL